MFFPFEDSSSLAGFIAGAFDRREALAMKLSAITSAQAQSSPLLGEMSRQLVANCFAWRFPTN